MARARSIAPISGATGVVAEGPLGWGEEGPADPPPMRRWNTRQLHVLRRYCRLHRFPLVPEVVLPLASRYARKHAAERARDDAA